MTKGELQRRKQAVVSGFIERNYENAFKYIKEILEFNTNNGLLYRFRPPKVYEIDTLETNEIFLCKPSNYVDNGDCEIIHDIQDLCKYFITNIKPEKYKNHKVSFNEKFYKNIIEMFDKNSKYIKLKSKIRDQALVACFTANYENYMWDNYASNSEGFCLVYSIHDLFLVTNSILKFFPVRYLDDRRAQKDIWFTSKEYNMDEDFEPAMLKFILSCLTKNRIPYSREYEWRLFCEHPNLDEDEKGQKVSFNVKPKFIIMGQNINYNLKFKSRLQEYAKKTGICLLNAKDYTIY